MNEIVVFSLFREDNLAENIIKKINAIKGDLQVHYFPDGECKVKVSSSVENKDIIIVTDISKPNYKILPLIFLAQTLQDLKVKSIGLIAPYLPYMRQDKSFTRGEGVSAKYFSQMLSNYFNWLITVDPHLHRYKCLDELYSISTQVISASSAISAWIKEKIKRPILIGPDSESKQWLVEIGKLTNAPYLILNKQRKGDKQVEITVPQIDDFLNHTPVIIDDIISSGRTMLETAKHVKGKIKQQFYCIGVHAIFAEDSWEVLDKIAEGNIYTCNTIEHKSNMIDLSTLIVESLISFISKNSIINQ